MEPFKACAWPMMAVVDAVDGASVVERLLESLSCASGCPDAAPAVPVDGVRRPVRNRVAFL
ncbi:MAG: hypothetical protein NVV66_00200 [Cellulomonas sp.]|uniref:hypothetical protein n=1 Tax=Cellulomonas sp. TaxID=40001 RepID=UPI002590B428|nr:hypothetical protein [Cellulomonas sp.]MCR6703175.1 hypothetical protein [Cellulomonas sp.]